MLLGILPLEMLDCLLLAMSIPVYLDGYTLRTDIIILRSGIWRYQTHWNRGTNIWMTEHARHFAHRRLRCAVGSWPNMPFTLSVAVYAASSVPLLKAFTFWAALSGTDTVGSWEYSRVGFVQNHVGGISTMKIMPYARSISLCFYFYFSKSGR